MKVTPKEGKEFIRQHWAKIDEIERVRKGPGITKRRNVESGEEYL